MAWDSQGEVDFCVLPTSGDERTEPRLVRLKFDAAFSGAKLRQAFRDLPIRPQRGTPVHVLVPSEDLLLLTEEFPSLEDEEVRTMAGGVMQGLTELDAEEHCMAYQILSRSASSTLCLLAIFHRKRIECIFENLQRLGISRPFFVVDVLADGVMSGAAAHDGRWGWASATRDGNGVILKVLETAGVLVRTIRQRFYEHHDLDAAWLQERDVDFFPEDVPDAGRGEDGKISWQVGDGAQHLGACARLIAEGRLTGLELQPVFWQERLRQRKVRRVLARVGIVLAGIYLVFLAGLGGLSVWQAHEQGVQSAQLKRQEGDFKAAMEVEHDLAMVRASLNPSNSAIEVLRQIVEPMTEGIVLENFSFRAKEGVKMRGTGTASEAVYDFVGRLRAIPLFHGAKVESVGAAPERGGVTWQVMIPLKPISAP